MPKTGLTVLFGQNALKMRTDFAVTVVQGGEQPLALAADLSNENSQKSYATFEPDYWLLDGNYKFIPAEAQIGYISTEMSGSGTSFTTSPLLRFVFNAVYSTSGLTLYFSEETNDYADAITVAFYDSSNVLIRTDNYTPSSWQFSTNQAVSNFKRIDITFTSTNKAYRYARLFNLDFDTLTRWSGGNVKDGKLVEQIDPLSFSLPSNQIEFTLHSSSSGFSITNPTGVYANLENNEPIEAYETVGDVDILLGRFYLADWNSPNDNDAVFTAVDAISLLDRPTFNCPVSGNYYAEDLIDQIMTEAGVDYTLDPSLLSISIWGTYVAALPNMSCREALQHVLVAIGAYATCSRSRVIQIRPFELASGLSLYDHTITAAQKGRSSVKLRKAVTDVEVYSWDYMRLYYDVPKLVYQKSVTPGTYRVSFDVPVPLYDPTSSTATITLPLTNYGRYWVEVVVTGAGTLTIEKASYLEPVKKQKILSNGSLPATTPVNVISLSNAYLVNNDFLAAVTQRIYDYYLQRHVQTVRLYGHLAAVGDSVLIDTQSAQQIKGIVERVTYDLTGGFIANAEIVGVVA